MLTVRGLVSEMGLELATGEDGADSPVRWVHISELPDPTPWLSGGELLLSTGIQLDTDRRQREFARLLAGHHLADHGLEGAIQKLPGLKPGVNVADGKVTHEAVAEGTGLPYTPVEDVLGVTA